MSPGDYILSFGKRKGSKLSEVPVHYLDWILGWANPDPLRTAVEAHLKTQAEYDAMGDDWKEGREDDDWRKF